MAQEREVIAAENNNESGGDVSVLETISTSQEQRSVPDSLKLIEGFTGCANGSVYVCLCCQIKYWVISYRVHARFKCNGSETVAEKCTEAQLQVSINSQFLMRINYLNRLNFPRVWARIPGSFVAKLWNVVDFQKSAVGYVRSQGTGIGALMKGCDGLRFDRKAWGTASCNFDSVQSAVPPKLYTCLK